MLLQALHCQYSRNNQLAGLSSKLGPAGQQLRQR
jgi:hypothetical protein